MCIARVSVVLFYVRTESVFYHFLKGILANFGSRLIKVLSAPTLLLLCILLCTLPDPDPDPDHDPDPDRDRAPVSVLLLHQLLCSCSSALAPNLSFLFLGSCCTCCCQRNCVQLLPVAVMLVNYSLSVFLQIFLNIIHDARCSSLGGWWCNPTQSDVSAVFDLGPLPGWG